MPQYQKHFGIATLHRQILISAAVRICLALTTLLGALALVHSPVHAQNSAAAAQAPFLILPVAQTAVRLQTHTADIELSVGAGRVQAMFSTFYRLRNDAKTAATVDLRIAPAGGETPFPPDLVVSVDGQALTLTPIDSLSYTAQVQLAPDSKLDLRMQYTLDFGSQALITVLYPAQVLTAWPGAVSLRVSLLPALTMLDASLLSILPSGWNYAPTEVGVQPALQWLFDGKLPERAITLRFVNPAIWQEVAQLETATAGAADATAAAQFVRLGQIYADLMTAAQESRDAADLQERFYAQSLAAYTDAVRLAGAAPADLGAAYRGQAGLYRQRMVTAGGDVFPGHAATLVDACRSALTALPADSAQRAELQQWQLDGLNVLLTDARNRRDWPVATALVDEMAQLPPTLVDPKTLEDERRRLAVQQALGLLEQDQRDAATALAGQGIVSAELLPPLESQSLFAAWHVTATISPTRVDLAFVGLPTPSLEADAHRSLDELLTALLGSAGTIGANVTLDQVSWPGAASAHRLHIDMPTTAAGLALANAAPMRPDWELLRSVLAQLEPTVDHSSAGLRDRLTLRQVIDLRGVNEKWSALAAGLEQQAQESDAQAAPTSRSDPAQLEAALQLRIRAANFRAAANHWLGLAENSQLVIMLTGPGGALSDGRAWQVSINTPRQTLQYETTVMNWGWLVLFSGIGLFGLFVLTGLLWWLL